MQLLMNNCIHVAHEQLHTVCMHVSCTPHMLACSTLRAGTNYSVCSIHALYMCSMYAVYMPNMCSMVEIYVGTHVSCTSHVLVCSTLGAGTNYSVCSIHALYMCSMYAVYMPNMCSTVDIYVRHVCCIHA